MGEYNLEELIFEDYIKPDMGHQKDASAIVTLVLKQISRGRFEIVDNICKVIILLNLEKRIVIISNAININEFRELKYIASPNEPSLDFLYHKIGVNEPLLISLKEYQDQFYKLGTEFKDEYWYKIYSKTEIKDSMRELYQAYWIDYEKQLENGSIIHDEVGICGLWAMPYHVLFKCFNEQCKERYGDKLFILKTVPECRYINDGKEIIGDRFEVINNYDLNSIEDIGKLLEYFTNLEKNKYNTLSSELNEKNQCLKIENEFLHKFLKQAKRKYTLLRWCFLLIGIVCGVIICKFIL